MGRSKCSSAATRFTCRSNAGARVARVPSPAKVPPAAAGIRHNASAFVSASASAVARTLVRCAPLAHVDLFAHELASEDVLPCEKVVRSTKHTHVLGFGAAAEGPRLTVVELEERTRRAAFAVSARVRAALTITGEHLAPGLVAHALGAGALGAGGSLGLAELLLFEVVQQKLNGSLHDQRDVSLRIRVAHQIERTLEFGAQLRAGGELDLVAVCLKLLRECGGSTGRRRATRRRQLADPGRHVRFGREARDDGLDLALGFSGDLAEQLHVIFRSQVGTEQGQRRQVHFARRHQLVDHGELPRQTRGDDAPVGLAFAHAEAAGAKVEEGWRCGAQVQPAVFDLGEVVDELGGDPATGHDEGVGCFDERVVAQLVERHVSHEALVPRRFLSALLAPGAAFLASDDARSVFVARARQATNA